MSRFQTRPYLPVVGIAQAKITGGRRPRCGADERRRNPRTRPARKLAQTLQASRSGQILASGLDYDGAPCSQQLVQVH